ncbi:hypothetical protein HJG60_011830 [Phyllostomus discolor]|uniref:Uncharacterized protein n=1 Tax=Phyllostomus discolor TaxID=89673 RepID=A0A834DYD6_9CHIR|nr:hypothetical protein HJG60_011830 [Phyllostomus discolor]
MKPGDSDGGGGGRGHAPSSERRVEALSREVLRSGEGWGHSVRKVGFVELWEAFGRFQVGERHGLTLFQELALGTVEKRWAGVRRERRPSLRGQVRWWPPNSERTKELFLWTLVTLITSTH